MPRMGHSPQGHDPDARREPLLHFPTAQDGATNAYEADFLFPSCRYCFGRMGNTKLGKRLGRHAFHLAVAPQDGIFIMQRT